MLALLATAARSLPRRPASPSCSAAAACAASRRGASRTCWAARACGPISSSAAVPVRCSAPCRLGRGGGHRPRGGAPALVRGADAAAPLARLGAAPAPRCTGFGADFRCATALIGGASSGRSAVRASRNCRRAAHRRHRCHQRRVGGADRRPAGAGAARQHRGAVHLPERAHRRAPLVDGVISDRCQSPAPPMPRSCSRSASRPPAARVDRPSRLLARYSTALLNNLMQARIERPRRAVSGCCGSS